MNKKILFSVIPLMFFFIPFTGCAKEANFGNAESRSESAVDTNSESPSAVSESIKDSNSGHSSSASEHSKENKHISGYVFSADENIMYLDTENPGPRKYPHEGEDRQVAFDISNAVIDIENDPVINIPTLRTSLSVDVDYFEKDGKNIATYVSGYGAEVAPLDPAFSTANGYLLKVEDNLIYIDPLNRGSRKYHGEGEDRAMIFDVSKAELHFPKGMDAKLQAGIDVDITYQIKNGKNIAFHIVSDGKVINPHAADEQQTSGFVLNIGDNIMYLDTENSGARTTPNEGEDRAVAFDLSEADIEIERSELTDNRNLRPGLCVNVSYYVRDGKNIATYVHSDGVEVEAKN